MASDGDIRVLLVLDFLLSFVFVYALLKGLAFIDVLAFSWNTAAMATAFLGFLTYLIVLR
ncbi:hypothetical protein [Natronomonas sp. EA1]|uniref:hypothetical protein n=1 Tax=Natronomonas sp. EA1 TaxID=3421655 RepID=UPI003EBCDE13